MRSVAAFGSRMFQSQMRSQFPRHINASSRVSPKDLVSISDEKPVPSPQLQSRLCHQSIATFQSQMRSQFPRHLYALKEVARCSTFQSQMRSQFPRHPSKFCMPLSELCVSISDEKPVPSPRQMYEHTQGAIYPFQSQMRSQFPRHELRLREYAGLVFVSISDEKPVPSPRYKRYYSYPAIICFNLR